MNYRLFLIIVVVCFSCGKVSEESESQAVTWEEFYASELFHEVQTQALFHDSKTFTDYIPRAPLGEIIAAYEAQKSEAEFDLRAFVDEFFEAPAERMSGFESDTTRSMGDHIRTLWPYLTREADNPQSLA